jgi:hypothetical protein
VTAVEAIAEVRRRGGRLYLDGSVVRCEVPKGAISEDLQEALESNREIIREIVRTRAALNFTPPDQWPEAWRERFEERAAILEFDAGIRRCEAVPAAAEQVRATFARESAS